MKLASIDLALADQSEEQVAHQAPRLDISLSECERIARIAFRIAQIDSDGKVLPPEGFRPWKDLSEADRIRARATVYRILQALCLTGWVQAG